MVGWYFVVVAVWESVRNGLSLVCEELGQEVDGQEATMEAEWATSLGYYHADCFG